MKTCSRCSVTTINNDETLCEHCKKLPQESSSPIKKKGDCSGISNCKNCTECGKPLRQKDINAHRNVCKTCRKKRRKLGKQRNTLKRIPITTKKKERTLSKEYLDYISSPEWQTKRLRILEYYGNKCAVCNRGGLVDVHHRTYERFKRELDTDLILLCRKCHKLFHGITTDD
jgi:hypothetical protein